MAYSLAHNGLIAVPVGSPRNGIHWLRLYRDVLDSVAIVTAVPGNPSFSVTNGTNAIVAHFEGTFGCSLGQLTLLEVWSRGALPPLGASIQRVDVAVQRRMSSSRREIGALVGPLPDLPAHQDLCASVVSRAAPAGRRPRGAAGRG